MHRRTMLLTGTTKGIGKAIYEFYKSDYNIITINRRQIEGKNIICDLSDYANICSILEKIRQLEIDILINNAGGAEPSRFLDMSPEELMRCTNLNYHAPVLLMQAVIKSMADNHYGKIINISSIASKSPRPLIAHYGAAKSALERFTSSMAVAYGGKGITINCICPGGVNTETSFKNREKMADLTGLNSDFFNNEMKEKNGLGRMIDTSEIVKLIEYLLSDAANAISGQAFNICGTREVH